VEIAVMYSTVQVVRGCSDSAVCSPDGLIMVAPLGSGTDVSGIGTRVISD